MLIGLGLGPGDKELLTLRALRLLKEAETVFVAGKMAADLVREHREPIVLSFPMVDDEVEIRRALVENADKIARAAASGTAVLGMIGDPSFYSTFSRQCEVLHEVHPEVECVAEPGVSSITAFASRAGVALNGGFVVTDGADPNALIMLKVKRPREKAEELRSKGYTEFVLAERIFLDHERIYRDDELPERSDYFSIMMARK